MENSKIRFGILGGGWRSEFFIRAAKAVPERFELAGVWMRSQQKAQALAQKYAVRVTTDLEELLETHLDYVVLCIPRENTLEYLEPLYSRGILVLCETPPSDSLENLNRVWELTQSKQGKIQVAEQYFLQPYHAAALEVVRRGYLGEVSNLRLSMVHGYHGVSLIRKYLNVGMQSCRISARHFAFPGIHHCDRTGLYTQGTAKPSSREVALLEFESGKTAFFDFDGEQYFSYIRRRSINVQGDRGELNDSSLSYLTEDLTPVTLPLHRVDTGADSNLEGFYHRGIQVGEQFMYRNPFPGARLTDDELAVASCMDRMGHYAKTGEEFYPLKEALQDAYLSLLMQQADQTTIQSAPQSWNR